MSGPDNIRSARKAKGLTLQAVATSVGVSMVTVSEWERGVKTPRADNAKKLIKALPSLTLNKIYAAAQPSTEAA